MSPSRLIIDLNRCFEPNAFNTGPPIPMSPHPSTLDISLQCGDPFELLESRSSNASTPDLTSSPTSSVGSSLHSLSLEDEEIRKIFYNPDLDFATNAVVQRYDTEPANAIECFPSKNDELNPLAVPFTPSFARLHCPEILKAVEPTFQPSPLDLGFHPIDFAHLSPHPNEYPHLDLPRRQCIPLPATYSPGPLQTPLRSEDEDMEPATAVPQISRYTPPVYIPLFQEAILPTTSDRLRKILTSAIVNSSTNWDIDALLELAELIGEESCKPGQHGTSSDHPLTACDVSRYVPVDQGPHGIDLQQEFVGQLSPSYVVADVAKHLYDQLNEMHQELGQIFAWNLRETILTRFIHCWDEAKPASINYQHRPHVHYVRSALALCKAIAALFTRGLITRDHVSMCLSILMKDLMSVEHFEALANLVLGCGAEFWRPVPGVPVTTVNIEAISGGAIDVVGEGLLLPNKQMQATTQIIENGHVTYFLSGLVANVVGRNLRGDESVVGQGWGQGQLSARIRQVVESVEQWESIVMNSPAVSII